MSVVRNGALAVATVVGAIALTGCSGDGGASECADLGGGVPGTQCIPAIRFAPNDHVQVALTPPAEDDGFQLTTDGVTLGPFEDDEWCETAVVPGTPDQKYAIQSFDVAMSPHYHHLFVAKAPVGSLSERLMEVGERVRCVGGAHVTYGADLVPIPLPQGELVHVDYPDGVGLVVHGGQKISINYHYLNTSDANAVAKVKLNFNGVIVTPDTPVTELQQFGFYNFDIHIPPAGSYASKWSVTFSQDVYVRDLFRHTHSLGRDFPVHHYTGPRNGGPTTGDLIFTSHDYQNDPGYVFLDPLFIRAGDGFTFTCNWENTHNYPVAFGPTADDEMCMLLGTWWVANDGEVPKTQDLVNTLVLGN
jgi:hypothetical protein